MDRWWCVALCKPHCCSEENSRGKMGFCRAYSRLLRLNLIYYYSVQGSAFACQCVEYTECSAHEDSIAYIFPYSPHFPSIRKKFAWLFFSFTRMRSFVCASEWRCDGWLSLDKTECFIDFLSSGIKTPKSCYWGSWIIFHFFLFFLVRWWQSLRIKVLG